MENADQRCVPTLCERIARVADLSAELDAASGFEDVMRLAGQVFDLYGSDRQFLSGVPMPGHGLEPLVILNTWRGAKGAACVPEPDDVVILKAQGWHSPFILRERYFGVSGLARHAALEETGRRLLIIPITMVLKYQGLAVMTFRPDPTLAGGQAEDSMKPCERGQLGLFLNLVFRRLSDLGILDRRREGELTAREREVLVFTAFGETASVTAHRLGISERTIVAHRQSAMHKLGACNTSEAVVKALLYGEIGPGAGFGFYKMAEEILVAGNYDYRETFA